MKLNPAHAIFDGNMFVQLRGLLESVTPPANLHVLDMSIGEPSCLFDQAVHLIW